MNDRKFTITYKGVEITGYRGSNWAYIGSKIFNSVRSAKIWITKQEQKDRKI